MNMATATPPPTEPLMTADEVAQVLRVSVSMVYKLRREGRLRGVQIGALWRFSPEFVRAIARGETVPELEAAILHFGHRRRV
jgi:excisionase family DNA binding protein